MSTKLILECMGCFNKVDGLEPINWYKPASYLGIVTAINKATPKGWVWRDPWTHSTYCPTCWASIVDGDAEPSGDSDYDKAEAERAEEWRHDE